MKQREDASSYPVLYKETVLLNFNVISCVDSLFITG